MKSLALVLLAASCAVGISNATTNQISVTGQWDFDQGDLRATIGADLQYVGTASNITTFSTVSIGGRNAQVMAFGSNSISQGFYMRHGANANGGGRFVNQYTLVMDVMFPASSSGQLRALFQTDPFNHPGNDAEFYIGGNSSSPDANGMGADGQFNGPLLPNTWYRLAFAVDLTAPPNQQLTKYVNGVVVGAQSLSGGIDGRYALGPTALLFTTGIATTGFTQPGYVNSIQFLNGCLTSNAVAALGRPTASGIPSGALMTISNSVQSASIKINWAGAKYPYSVQKTSNVYNPTWQNVGSLDSLGNIAVPANDPAGFFRVNSAISSSLIDPGTPLEPNIPVGTLPSGDISVPTKQILHTAGQTINFTGRPVDIALSPDGTKAYIKNMNDLRVVDAVGWNMLQTLNYPASGASYHGICVAHDGSHVYVTGCGNDLYDWVVSTNGSVTFSRDIFLPTNSDPCGITLSPDNSTAYVCLGRSNSLAVVNLAAGTVTQLINVGIAPWDVALSSNGTTAYVSDWGGRYPGTNDLTANSVNTQVVVDSRGIASSGVVSIVNLTQNREVDRAGYSTTLIAVHLHRDIGKRDVR